MRHQSPLLLLASTALVSGCSGQGWKQHPLSNGTVPALSTERPVRVTRIDRTVIMLEHPRIVADSLIGDMGNPPERVALLLRDVQRMEERSVGGTASQKASRWAARTGLRLVGTLVIVWLLSKV